MCGIAGYYSTKPITYLQKKEILRSMKRRGPDNQNHTDFIYNDKIFVTLFHSRLSIIDLSKNAQQPFKFGRKHITFNGEIYNYLEIKKHLELKGIKFYTKSDTEVLAQAINYWGYEGLDKLEGMWAFAVYDEQEGSLTLCRDRFGEKPLYYYIDVNGNIFFGSEIKYIFQMTQKKFHINTYFLKNFLINGYKCLNKIEGNFFRDIREIKSGSIKKISMSKLTQEFKYWNPNFDEVQISMTEAIKTTRDKLINAIKLRLRSDVPLGFCMSGGIDSNSIIAIAKKIFKYEVEGFTIVNTDKRYEEKSIIDQVVKELKIKHNEINLSKDNFLNNMRILIKHHDNPIYTISYYVHWLLLKKFKQKGYRISLSGTGADELFSGYYDHHNFYLSTVFSNQEKYKIALNEWKKNIKKIVRNPYLQDPNVFISNPFERNQVSLGKEKFVNYFKNPESSYFSEIFYTSRILRNRMLNEMFVESVPIILHEDDANSMFHSIENRSPFLDRKLFEFACSVPDEYLIQKGMTKYILREAVKGIVPEIVLNQKKKIGFNAPLESLIDTNDPETKKNLLSDGPIWEILDKNLISEELSNTNLTNSMSKFLFSFISTKIFLEEYS